MTIAKLTSALVISGLLMGPAFAASPISSTATKAPAHVTKKKTVTKSAIKTKKAVSAAKAK